MSENKTADRTDSRWELVVTSKTMKLWAWGSAAVVMAVHIFMGLVVDVGDELDFSRHIRAVWRGTGPLRAARDLIRIASS